MSQKRQIRGHTALKKLQTGENIYILYEAIKIALNTGFFEHI